MKPNGGMTYLRKFFFSFLFFLVQKPPPRRLLKLGAASSKKKKIKIKILQRCELPCRKLQHRKLQRRDL